MKKIIFTAAFITAVLPASVFALPTVTPVYTLTIGTPGVEDGSVALETDGYGGFGETTRAGRNIGPANFTFLGSQESTTESSFIAVRFGNDPQSGQLSGAGQYIGSGFFIETNVDGNRFPAPDGSFTQNSASSSQVDTSFSSPNIATSDLKFNLVQTTGQFDTDPMDSTKKGSFHQSDYELENTSMNSISGELLRYAHFALSFSSGDDRVGGGILNRNGVDYLYSTASLVPDNADTVYAAISAGFLDDARNPNPTVNRFELGTSIVTDKHVLNDTLAGPLTDDITGDTNDDGRTNSIGPYALAFRNSFTIAPGESIVYRTSTFWAAGKIDNFNPPSNGGGGNPAPSPGSLALLGMAGLNLGRFRKVRQHS